MAVQTLEWRCMPWFLYLSDLEIHRIHQAWTWTSTARGLYVRNEGVIVWHFINIVCVYLFVCVYISMYNCVYTRLHTYVFQNKTAHQSPTLFLMGIFLLCWKLNTGWCYMYTYDIFIFQICAFVLKGEHWMMLQIHFRHFHLSNMRFCANSWTLGDVTDTFQTFSSLKNALLC